MAKLAHYVRIAGWRCSMAINNETDEAQFDKSRQRAAKIEELQRLVDAGLESGISGRSMTEILETARTRAQSYSK